VTDRLPSLLAHLRCGWGQRPKVETRSRPPHWRGGSTVFFVEPSGLLGTDERRPPPALPPPGGRGMDGPARPGWWRAQDLIGLDVRHNTDAPFSRASSRPPTWRIHTTDWGGKREGGRVSPIRVTLLFFHRHSTSRSSTGTSSAC
jgi:hypothetical protein